MTRYNECGCSGHVHSGCNPCTSHNEIQQAVNNALALEKENLEQYENNAAQSASDAAKEAAKAAESASAAAQSQTNAETAAGTATQAASSVTNTAVVLEETAERIEQAQDLLEEQISALHTKPVYFEVTTPTSSLVLPETETVFNVRSIYVASARQDVGYGFTFDKATRTITLAEAITADQIAETAEGFILVTAICDVYNSDDPTSFPIILASNAGANNVGTSTGDTVETRLATLDSQVDPTLRQDLGSVDGFKLMGRCPDIATLRTIEPSIQGQKIEVVSYYNDWASTAAGPIGGGEFYYDNSDTTSLDDGLIIFVTAGGRRWKRRLTDGNLSFQMGGVRPGEDCTSVFKALVKLVLAKYRAATTTDAAPINYDNNVITSIPGTYILTETIQLYTVTPFRPMGDVTFDGRSITSGAGIFKLSNDGLSSQFKPKYLAVGPILNGNDGTINIVGALTVPGIAIGNTQSGCVVFAGWITHNLQITYVKNFMVFNGAVDTYLMKFTQTRGYRSAEVGIHFPATTFSNSGERISFDEITLGGAIGDFIKIDQPGIMLSFSNMSLDFGRANGLVVSESCTYAQIDVSGASHIEGIEGYFIKSMARTSRVLWDGGQWLPTSNSTIAGTYTNYQGRPLVYGALKTVTLRDIYIFNNYPANDENIFIGVPSDSTRGDFLNVTGLFDTHGYIPAKTSIANTGYDFSAETVGNVLTASTPLARFQKPTDMTSWLQGLTATVVALSDGTKALQLVPTTTGLTGNYLVLTSVNYLPVQPASTVVKVWAVAQILRATLRVRVQTQVKWYDSEKTLIATTTAGGTSDLPYNAAITTAPSYSSDPEVNGTRKLATYVGTNNAPAGACYAKPVWTFSGIDQTVNINQLCCSVEGGY